MMRDSVIEEQKRPLILIVDDVPKNIQVLGNILGGAGYSVAAATGGRQAVEMSKDLIPDIVLLDVMMPDIDGYEVCRLLKESSDTGDVPVIFITAKTEKEDTIRGFTAGGVDYITKPFNAAELLVRVDTHLKLKAALETEKKLTSELKEALAKVKHLTGLLPICSHCKKIRDDSGYWNQVEEYVQSHSNATFSHSICPDCVEKYYPQIAQKLKKKHGKI